MKSVNRNFLMRTVSALLAAVSTVCAAGGCTTSEKAEKTDAATEKNAVYTAAATDGKVTTIPQTAAIPETEEDYMIERTDFKTLTEEEFSEKWTVIRENKSKWKLESGSGLALTTMQGELYGTDNSARNIFMQEATGNYIIETKIDLSQIACENYQQGGLMIYADDDNYVKLVCACNFEPGVQFAYESGGSFTSCAIVSLKTEVIWLRIKKVGRTYTAYYTPEGIDSGYQELGSCTVSLKKPRRGLVAFNGSTGAKSMKFTFEYFDVLETDAPVTTEKIYNMKISESELRMNPGQTLTLSASAIEKGAGKVSYRSSDSGVVSVDENGVITAVGEGYAVISATVEKGNPAVCVVSVVPETLYRYKSIGNPYLPLWEHIPDGEPYVFEDPDNPGKYRLYVYGSHDTVLTTYCGYEQVVWSAPVEDLTDWTYHGEIFKSTVQGGNDLLFAPDIAEVVGADGKKTYYFYPNNQTAGRRNMVAKSSRPDGPFTVCNWAEGTINQTEGPLGFDVAILYDNGRVYGYWGFEYGDKCQWAELDPDDMSTLKEGTEIHNNLPTVTDVESGNYNPADYNIVQDENIYKWGFFEASSIRKVGNKYVFVYSRRGLTTEPTGRTVGQLAYGYSDSPEGPWKYGGIIVDAAGETLPNAAGGYDRSFPDNNTHGSICEINGQWYIFYHRSNNMFSRQSMVDKITLEWDEKSVADGGGVRISMAEVTSNGFYTDGLDPYAKYPASMACFMTGESYITPVYEKPAEYEPLTVASNNSIIGIKYFNFDKNAGKGKNTELKISLKPLGKNVTVDVYLRPDTAADSAIKYKSGSGDVESLGEGCIKAASFDISSSDAQEATEITVPMPAADRIDGQWGLFFVFRSTSGGNLCELYTVEFTAD